MFSDNSTNISNANIIDDVCLTSKIVSDKTGTITKNEMELSKIIYKDIIIDVEKIYNRESLYQQKDLLRCLGICIHFEEDDYKTPEDKTIRQKYCYLDCKVSQYGNFIDLHLPDYDSQYMIEKWEYIHVKGLEFSHTKNISSKIVKNESGVYCIYSKGSISELTKRLLSTNIYKIKECDAKISLKFPSLRVMACGFRELSQQEISLILCKEYDNLFLENDLNFLGLIGIRDNVQEGVLDTIQTLNKAKIYTSICTGDRKITALAIAKEIGIIHSDFKIVQINAEFLNTIDEYVFNNTVFLISGHLLQKIVKDRFLLKKLEKCILNSPSFIAYSLIPELKKKLIEILEKNDCKTLAIGDGFNDIDMIRNANTGIAIRNFNNYNVTNEADIVLENFKNLKELILVKSRYSYIRNSTIAKLIFYRCVMISFLLMGYIILNNGNTRVAIFDGIIIQGLNTIWTIVPSIYYSLFYRDVDKAEIYKYPKQHLNITLSKYLNFQILNLVNITSILVSLLSIGILFYFYSDFEIIRYQLGICIILTIFNKIFFIESKNLSPIHSYYMTLVSIINVSSYIIFMTWYTSMSINIYNYRGTIIVLGIAYILDIISHIIINKLYPKI